MSEEALYNKIDKFCNKTDWSKYPTYEHALEEFIKEIVEEETKELKKENKVLAQNLEDTEILNKTYEKRFSDLEKENAELRNNGFTVSAMTEQQLKVALEKGEQLEKKNAELDCQKNRNKFCYSCANATERCFRNEIGCPCEKYKSYKDENAELKLKLEALEGQTPWKDIKDKSEVIGQLTNAKEIISEYVRLANLEKEDTIAIWQLYHKAEQFIKEE